MRLLDLVSFADRPQEQDACLCKMLTENIQRARILSVLIIMVDGTLALFDMLFWLSGYQSAFLYAFYLSMYLLMVAVSSILLLYLRGQNPSAAEKKKLLRLENIFTIYITFAMVWGAVISLADQFLYSQVVPFIINVMACAVIYLLPNRKMLLPFAVSSAVIFIGLPFTQHSSNILIGHYINLVIFVLLAWVTSRLMYHNTCKNINGRELLEQSNRLFQAKINENHSIQQQLIKANQQLKILSSVDELTGIPNRRGFNDYINRVLSYQKNIPCSLSLLMIDIDLFKEYNDCRGHIGGDKVLVSVARVISDIAAQNNHFAARFGGEEFIYAAFGIDEGQARKIANDIREQALALHIPHDCSAEGFLTVSAGIHTQNISAADMLEDALVLSDEALYAAKAGGRNCIRCSAELDASIS